MSGIRDLVTALCAATALGAAASAAAQPGPPGGRPPPLVQRVQLGGTATFGRESLERIAPAGAVQACSSHAFTVAEIARVAGARVFDRVDRAAPGMRPSTTRMVRLVARNDKGERAIALSTYVQQLNQVEAFYNAHGLTLRRGPLALRGALRPDDNRRRAPCRSRDDLPLGGAGLSMIRYRLVDKPVGPSNGSNGPRVEPGDVPELKPNPPGPGDVMGTIGTIGNPVINPADLTLAGRAQLRTRLATAGAGAPRVDAPLLTPMSGNTCAACTYEIGKTAYLTPAAHALIERPNEVVYTKYSCKILTDSANNAEKCPEIHKIKVDEVTRAEQWAQAGLDVPFFLANHQSPCTVLKKYPKNGVGLGDLYTLAGTGGGTEVKQTGTVAGSFFDGSLKYSNQGIADCVLDLGSTNSLFGAQFCLRYDTLNTYAPKAGLKVVNGAGLDTGVRLFGQDFTLVDGRAQIDWTQPVPGATVQPMVSSTLDTASKTYLFEGPQGTFFIGPVPLTVRTFADASLWAGQPVPTFVAPPLKAGIAGVGRIGMKSGGTSDVSLNMEAGIDAVILSAGISGKLSLLKNSVTGGIVSELDPKANVLNVVKSYDFTSTSLSGTISAFVEVDLFVYSERYSVELLSFPGTTHTLPLQSTTWGPIKAVVPSTAKTSTGCAP